MAKVHITNVVVLDNPSSFFSPFQFELTFECIEELQEDLEWKMIYVGSAESEDHDQVLDTIYVGPVPEGRHIFVFQADPPDVTKIPEQDAVGVTIVLLTCSYRGQEFVRVGYFINNDYADPEMRENPPSKPLFDKLTRNILASKPRVTRFKVNWDDAPASNGVPLPNANGTAHIANVMEADDSVDNMDMRDESQDSMTEGLAAAGIIENDEPSTSATANANAAIIAACTAENAAATPPINNTADTPKPPGNASGMCVDDNSLAVPIPNGAATVNDNSNSVAMEC